MSFSKETTATPPTAAGSHAAVAKLVAFLTAKTTQTDVNALRITISREKK